jgi:hypothetical protein
VAWRRRLGGSAGERRRGGAVLSLVIYLHAEAGASSCPGLARHHQPRPPAARLGRLECKLPLSQRSIVALVARAASPSLLSGQMTNCLAPEGASELMCRV